MNPRNEILTQIVNESRVYRTFKVYSPETLASITRLVARGWLEGGEKYP